MNINTESLIEVERIRNIAESQFANSKLFFLMGSKALFDQQKKEKQTLLESLTNFEKLYNIPGVSENLKNITTVMEKNQEIFEQAMEFREKQTESKIVGQFYQSKTSPLIKQLNDSLDSIVQAQKAQLEQAQHTSKEAASEAEVQIPKGMTWFTIALAILFVGLAFLILRMLQIRKNHINERDRLYNEAKNAVQDRDELISAITHDFNDSLTTISQSAQTLTSTNDVNQISHCSELIRSSVSLAEASIKDICDQKNAEMKGLTLRMSQLNIDEILDDVRLIMQPFAKQQDVRLQFDSVNPPLLAFFDRERVIRILWNLIGNAIKHSPKHSKVVIKVRSDQKFIYIAVLDSGPGISEQNQTKIFTEFWQAKKTADQGPGIGLAVAKTIVEAHGGTLTVESQSGYGSTFTFSLPRRRPVGANINRPTAIVKQKFLDAHSNFSSSKNH